MGRQSSDRLATAGSYIAAIFEDVAPTKPDAIPAAYSGITEEDYSQLSEITPTVAYPEKRRRHGYE